MNKTAHAALLTNRIDSGDKLYPRELGLINGNEYVELVVGNPESTEYSEASTKKLSVGHATLANEALSAHSVKIAGLVNFGDSVAKLANDTIKVTSAGMELSTGAQITGGTLSENAIQGCTKFVLSSDNFGSVLPSSGEVGQIFFKISGDN